MQRTGNYCYGGWRMKGGWLWSIVLVSFHSHSMDSVIKRINFPYIRTEHVVTDFALMKYIQSHLPSLAFLFLLLFSSVSVSSAPCLASSSSFLWSHLRSLLTEGFRWVLHQSLGLQFWIIVVPPVKGWGFDTEWLPTGWSPALAMRGSSPCSVSVVRG